MSNVEEQRQKRLVHLRAIEADLEKANLSIRKMDETVVKFSSADPVPPDVTTRYAKIVSASQEALVEVRRRQKERADMWSHFAPSRLTDLEKSYERKSS